MKLNLCEKAVFQIQECRSTRTTLLVEGDLWDWLEKQGRGYQLTYLLGHTLNGVIWGRMVGGQLQIAVCDNNTFTTNDDKARLAAILSEIRLFNETTELHLWRANGNWQASLIQDSEGSGCEYLDEKQMLWGTQIKAANEQFTLMGDGIQGLYHAVPLHQADIPVNENGNYRPLRLHLRHYLADDDMGRVHIAFSRLLDLSAEAEEENDGA